MGKEAWQDLLEHLLSLQDTVFGLVDEITCYKVQGISGDSGDEGIPPQL